MAEYSRPQGFRFLSTGVNLRNLPDALPPDKYASLRNVRSFDNLSLQTRPGYSLLFTAAAALPITDLQAFAVIGGDDAPRILARDNANHIIGDSGATLTTLGGTVGAGVSMIPFRPGASPQTWMYIGGYGDYQKIQAPLGPAQKVGIAEPQTPCQAIPWVPGIYNFNASLGTWTPGGVAGAVTTPTPPFALTSVAFVTLSGNLKGVQVSSTQGIQTGMLVSFSGGPDDVVVQDVFPPTGGGITIAAIYYFSGTSGLAVVVPSQSPVGSGPLGPFRRGQLVQLGGSEIDIVLGEAQGPDGSVAFLVSTTATFGTGAAILGLPTILVEGTVGGTITLSNAMKQSTLTLGAGLLTSVGTVSSPLSPSPFSQPIQSGVLPQADDYLHLVLNFTGQAVSQGFVEEVEIIFNTSPTVDYSTQFYSITLAGAGLTDGLNEIHFPLSSLTPNTSKGQLADLLSANGVQINVTITGPTGTTVTLQWGGFSLQGGGQGDIGDLGADYDYRAVPRSSLTGASGNSTPPMRYGVKARRQNVKVFFPSMAYDSQIDTVDIYRRGGSITSFQYIGSAPASAGTFLDTFPDSVALAGQPLPTDNFEPWPSIDVPFDTRTGGQTLGVNGTAITLTGGTFPPNITRWLPGTLINVIMQGTVSRGQPSRTYTLYARPTTISGGFLLQIEESADANATPVAVIVQEPLIANQPLPYLWGPDEQGVVFGVGDPLRPGTVYFSKAYNLDSAPDSNTLELCPPSEPLLGGEKLQGVSLVGSTMRWWALYPSFSNPSAPYTQIEREVGRALIAPFAHCSDGTQVFFWAKDGICSTSGGPFTSLTDSDLYPLFPHEGVQGQNVVRNGDTYYAPNYARTSQFRLAWVGKFLFAHYPDSGGTYRTLVYDTNSKGWSQDIYANQILCHFPVWNQAGSLVVPGTLYPFILLGDTLGNVWVEAGCSNDAGVGISCRIATAELDGGDQRALMQWGDSYLDIFPNTTVTVTPISQGVPVAIATTIPVGPSRVFAPISLAGGALLKFLGLQIDWIE